MKVIESDLINKAFKKIEKLQRGETSNLRKAADFFIHSRDRPKYQSFHSNDDDDLGLSKIEPAFEAVINYVKIHGKSPEAIYKVIGEFPYCACYFFGTEETTLTRINNIKIPKDPKLHFSHFSDFLKSKDIRVEGTFMAPSLWRWMINHNEEKYDEIGNGSTAYLYLGEEDWGFSDDEAIFGHLSEDASEDDEIKALEDAIAKNDPTIYKEADYDKYPEHIVEMLKLLKEEFSEHIDDQNRLRFRVSW